VGTHALGVSAEDGHDLQFSVVVRCQKARNAGGSPDGSMVHVSIWDSEEHAGQMRRLKEMIVDARNDAEKAGGQLHPDRQLPGRLGVGFPS
jgi:hypothetical protein